ncbi:hypothetical protein [Alkalibacterium sp. 20]|uniref:hypothetical protein n=1 Tax=Alkalibacterium sp. 20 TaxID=1798803 RepID=UPI0009004DCE|nr:hypothetical protein [Alkalibacterium sp. 20]OJF92715.1 hypothetical protein AX762_09700 [Alkalibacterium sp. 20]
MTLYTEEVSALVDVEAQELDGYISVDANRPSLKLEGSDLTINSAVLRWMQETFSPLSAEQEN